MAGRLTVSTLNNDTGVLATQNGMTGIAKAWVQFGGGAGGYTAGAIQGSFNVSSVTVNATGDYTVNFTTAMPNTTYAAVFSTTPYGNGQSGAYPSIFGYPGANFQAPTTTTCRVGVTNTSNNGVINQLNCLTILAS